MQQAPLGRIAVREATVNRHGFRKGQFQGRAIETIDLAAILGHARQVQMRRLLLGLADAQRRLAIWVAKLDTIRRSPFLDNSYAERFEGRAL